jgi:hypothetical protein
VTETPLSVAYFDADRARYGMVRQGTTLLFEGKEVTALSEEASVEPDDGGYRVELQDRLRLAVQPVTPPADLRGTQVRVCRVRGRVGSGAVEGLATVSETVRPPSFDELDALRAVSVLVDEETALLALARRPRGARGHGDELVLAWLVQGGELVAVETARISTVYDGDGRQRSAGLELWLPGEDFPRRASGQAAAGSSLELEGLRVHAAVFRWRLEGREGLGQYELVVREEEPEAA